MNLDFANERRHIEIQDKIDISCIYVAVNVENTDIDFNHLTLGVALQCVQSLVF